MPILTPAMATSFIVLFGTGTAMTLMLRQGNLTQLMKTAWGWVILIGVLMTVAICVVGFGIRMPTGIRLEKLGRSFEERAPSPEEGQQMQRLLQ